MSACQKPGSPAPTPPPTPPPAPVAAKPEVKATELADLGLKLTLAAGWQARETPANVNLLPDAPQPAIFEKTGAKETPLLVLGKVAPSTLGEGDVKQAPGSLIAGLRKSLGAAQSGLAFVDTAASSFKGFESAKALTAVGPFADLGLSNATGRFVAAVTPGGTVYLLAGFAPDATALAEVDAMLASIEAPASATPAEAAKPAPEAAKPAEMAKPAEAPKPAPDAAKPANEPAKAP
jgi:hypothetical protein